MKITELVLQGIRRFAQPRKLIFQPGLNAFLGGAQSGKSTIREVIIDLLFPQPMASVQGFFKEGTAAGPSRAGAGFQENQTTLRNVVDYAQGSSHLSKMVGGATQYEALSQDRDQIGDLLREFLKLPDYEVYRILCVTQPVEFPSHKVSSFSRSAPVADLGADPAALAREVAHLRKLRADAQKIKNMQYEIEGHFKEMFELQDILKRSTAIEEKLAKINEELGLLGNLPELPDDWDDRVESYDKSARRHNNEVPALQGEIHQLKDALAYDDIISLPKDGKFIMGCVLLLLSIVAGIGSISGGEETAGANGVLIALLAVALAGIGLIVMRLSAFVSSKEDYEGLKKDLAKKEEKLKNVERKFEVETSVVRTVIRNLNVDSTSELKSSVTKILKLRGEAEELKKQLEVEKAKPGYQKAISGIPELKKKAAEMEQELSLLSATPLDLDQIEMQLAHLEVKAKESGTALPGAGATQDESWQKNISPEFIEKIGRDYFNHATHRLIAVCGYGLNIDMEAFLPKVLPPLSKNLSAFSMNNLSEPNIEIDGTFSVIDQEIKTRSRFEQLEPFKQDLAYFALKFTLLQFLIRENPLPILFDSALAHFDERLAGVLTKSLQFLGQQTQVVLLTDNEPLANAFPNVQRL